MTQAAQAVEEETSRQAGNDQDNSAVQAQSAELSEVAATKTTAAAAGIDILLDMDVPVTVIIGQTQIPVQQLLQLGPGSVLKLDKSIDAPADLYLKDVKFAAGNIVVVEDNFAVRITEILGPGTTAAGRK